MKTENINKFLMPIVIKEVSIRLANGNTKYDNHGGGQAMLLTKDHGTRCAIETVAYVRHNWITRPDEITENE